MGGHHKHLYFLFQTNTHGKAKNIPVSPMVKDQAAIAGRNLVTRAMCMIGVAMGSTSIQHEDT